jgi:formylglycine-generating enzyme
MKKRLVTGLVALVCVVCALLAGCKSLSQMVSDGESDAALAEIAKQDKIEDADQLLVAACSKGMRDVAKALIVRGAKVNVVANRSASGNRYLQSATPLIAAVNANNRALVDYLLAEGADAGMQNLDGINALTVAKDPGIIELLVNLGVPEQVQVMSVNVNGIWPLGFPDLWKDSIYVSRTRPAVLAQVAQLEALGEKYFRGSSLSWMTIKLRVKSEAENLGRVEQAQSYNRMVELADEIPAEINRLKALAATIPAYRSARLAMKEVPAGSFQRDASAANVSTVTARFLMSETEVTRAQWAMVTGQAAGSSGSPADPASASWYSAMAFCNCLSLAENLTPAYTVSGATDPEAWGALPSKPDPHWDAVTVDWSANGYRLPTEMEWMWAAMGGCAGDTGYKKPFAGSTGNNKAGEYAWIDANSGDKMHPVATRQPNELGLFDMSGNLWELCWDWYGSYPNGALSSDSPEGRGAPAGTTRVFRGGSYHEDCKALTYRTGYSPSALYMNAGFRVVRR